MNDLSYSDEDSSSANESMHDDYGKNNSFRKFEFDFEFFFLLYLTMPII